MWGYFLQFYLNDKSSNLIWNQNLNQLKLTSIFNLYTFLKILMSKILIDNATMLSSEILSILPDTFSLKKCDLHQKTWKKNWYAFRVPTHQTTTYDGSPRGRSTCSQFSRWCSCWCCVHLASLPTPISKCSSQFSSSHSYLSGKAGQWPWHFIRSMSKSVKFLVPPWTETSDHLLSICLFLTVTNGYFLLNVHVGHIPSKSK